MDKRSHAKRIIKEATAQNLVPGDKILENEEKVKNYFLFRLHDRMTDKDGATQRASELAVYLVRDFSECFNNSQGTCTFISFGQGRDQSIVPHRRGGGCRQKLS